MGYIYEKSKYFRDNVIQNFLNLGEFFGDICQFLLKDMGIISKY